MNCLIPGRTCFPWVNRRKKINKISPIIKLEAEMKKVNDDPDEIKSLFPQTTCNENQIEKCSIASSLCGISFKSAVPHDGAGHQDNPYLKYIRKVKNLSSQQGTRRSLSQNAEKISSKVRVWREILMNTLVLPTTHAGDDLFETSFPKIIQDFLDWYNSLGGAPSEIGIDHGTLQKLFQVGFDAPKSQKINENTHSDEFGQDAQKALNCDIRIQTDEVKKWAAIVGPQEKKVRKHSKIEHREERKMHARHDLEAMATVFQGIENLWSTIAFCDWLKSHPDIRVPAYLLNMGLLKIDHNKLLAEFGEFKDLEAANTQLRGTLPIPIRSSTSHSEDLSKKSKKIVRPCRRNVS